MSRYHRCDPRSDYNCAECHQRQLDAEREAEARDQECGLLPSDGPGAACDEPYHPDWLRGRMRGGA